MKFHAVLDPSKENKTSAGWRIVGDEIEFLRYDGNQNQLWISGESLCRWASDVYRVRGWREGEEYRVLQSPQLRLQYLLGEKAHELTGNTLTRITDAFDRLNHEAPDAKLEELLVLLTGDDLWTTPPSVLHAARWLLADIDGELQSLVEVQQERWAAQAADVRLKSLYSLAVNERSVQLKSWLLDDGAGDNGFFPFKVEGDAAKLLIDEWGKLLRATKGSAIERLSPRNPNADHIAAAAYEYLSRHTDALTANTIQHVAPYLPVEKRVELERAIPKPPPAPLAEDATLEDALAWSVGEYLPFRQWQVRAGNNADEEYATQLSESFADWLLTNYPRLSMANRDASYLNVRVKAGVDVLLQNAPVLWVVVDGLNHINHQRLLKLLAETESSLGIEEDHTLMSILPTVTEQAKYSLTSGLFPGENTKPTRSIRDVFLSAFPQGKYVSNNRIDNLHAALSAHDFHLCYWNVGEIDDCYHKQTNPLAAQHNIEARLLALAKNISDLVLKSPHRDRLAVVICTDHGQMLGSCVRSEHNLRGASAHGRTAYKNLLTEDGEAVGGAYVKDADSSVVVLNPTLFRLKEPVTLALKNFYFSGWSEDAGRRAWGVHGGLSPEEVVVGFSVLKRKPARQPVTAVISGSGEAKKPGALTLTVDNPNHAPITCLSLLLDVVEQYRQGLPIRGSVLAVESKAFDIKTTSFPAPISGDSVEVKGTLFYEFDDGVMRETEVTGALTSVQMYSNQRPSLRNRFKR